MGEQLATVVPSPAAGDLAAVLAKLDAVLAEQHLLRRLIHRIAVPLEVLSLKDACRRLARSNTTVKALVARGVFSDGRAPENRKHGANLLFFADEIEAYLADGEGGVRRLRSELGRN